MTKYIIKKIMAGLFTIFVLITVTFFLTRIMPGNPFEGGNVSGQVVESLKEQYGMDKPVIVQYEMYLSNLMHGDLGTSFKKPGMTINEIIKRDMGPTMKLGLISFVFSTVIGIGIGIWQAMTKRNSVKGFLIAGSTIGVSVPNFVFALLLMIIFGVQLQFFPIIGLTSPASYVLPVIAQSVYPIAVISRLVNTTFSEALKQDHVVMARAKGLKEISIIFKHVLKNSMVPVVTYLGPTIAFLLTGSFVIESLYTIPGLGMEFVNSISNRDYTVILGLSIFIGTVIIIANMLVDVICAFIDPRIKLS